MNQFSCEGGGVLLGGVETALEVLGRTRHLGIGDGLLPLFETLGACEVDALLRFSSSLLGVLLCLVLLLLCVGGWLVSFRFPKDACRAGHRRSSILHLFVCLIT